MNEEYLKQFRKSPDSQFVEMVHARIGKKERAQIIKRYAFLSVLALVSVLGMLMTFSSTVRADVLQIIKEIAGLQYEITSDCPGCSDDVTIIEPGYLSLEDARSRFPSPVQLPTYIPQGYERLADVELYNWGNGASPSLMVIWEKWEENKLFGRINLDITQCPSGSPSCGLIVGEGALEEVTLNGKPAVIVRGAWSYDTQQYDLSAGIDIQWRYDENTVYRLSYGGEDMLDELIRMAESIP